MNFEIYSFTSYIFVMKICWLLYPWCLPLNFLWEILTSLRPLIQELHIIFRSFRNLFLSNWWEYLLERALLAGYLNWSNLNLEVWNCYWLLSTAIWWYTWQYGVRWVGFTSFLGDESFARNDRCIFYIRLKHHFYYISFLYRWKTSKKWITKLKNPLNLVLSSLSLQFIRVCIK